MQIHSENKNYMEADKCWKEAQKLKADISKYEGRELKQQQKKNYYEITALQKEEAEALHGKWNSTFAEINEEFNDMRNQLAEKQEK